ncbi:MAG: putative ribosomal N-acetyltransferase YdaF [bacterium]|nr:putative ribosomal N-acetyltransferase YdaF [bacterium]
MQCTDPPIISSGGNHLPQLVRYDRLMLRLQVRPDCWLRPLVARDASLLFWHVEANREHLRAWVEEIDALADESATRYWLEQAVLRAREGRSLLLGYFEGGRLIGTVGLHHIDRADASTEIGYWLAEDRQGQGLMTAAVSAVVTYVFEEWRLNRVEIVCPEENARSRAIPERLGFVLEGQRRQAMMLRSWPYDLCDYGLLASEWARRRAR